MRSLRILLTLLAAWCVLGLSPLRAEVLVRISSTEQVHQIRELNHQAWIATESGAYRIERNQLIPVFLDLPVVTVAAVDGQAWLGTSSGLYRVGADGNITPIFQDIIENERIQDIEVAGEDIWIGGSEKLTLIKGQVKKQKLRGYVNDIVNIDGTIWVGTNRNAYRINSSEDPIQIFTDPVEVVRVLKAGNYIWFLTTLGAQFYGPCFRLDISTGDYLPEKYFDGEEVLTIAEVRNEIWFGTTHGLFRATKDMRRFPRQDLPNRRVHSIKVIKDQIWVATSQQAYRVVEDNYESVPSISATINVHDFVPVEEKLWFAAHDGAYRLDEDVQILFRTNVTSFLNTSILLGDTARILDVRYDRQGKDPYGELPPGDFEAILEKDSELFEKSLQDGDFIPVTKLERAVPFGYQEWHLIVRDNFGNATRRIVLPVYVFSLRHFLLLLLLPIAILVFYITLKERFLNLFHSGKKRGMAPPDNCQVADRRDTQDQESVKATHKTRRKRTELSLISERYLRQDLLGEGGMGRVYHARDLVLQRAVALKFLNGPLATGEQEKRFLNEAKLMARLNHANIATVYDIEKDDNEFFIVMEFIEGRNLGEFLEEDPGRCMSDMQEIFIQIGKGLNHAHGEGIVHRDIKPQNVMVRRDGVVKLMDFGVAKLVSDFSQTTKGILGTPTYMAPEQIRGSEITHKADIYALGVMLYQMATGGQLPFTGIEVMTEKLTRKPELPSKINPEIAPDLDSLILHCLEIDPSERPQNAMTFVRELVAIDPLFHK